MKRIDEIDKNLKVTGTIEVDDIVFYNAKEEPIDIYGLYNPRGEEVFKRLPDDVAAATSEGVAILAKNTAGGRARFCTDSEYVAIRAESKQEFFMSHMTLMGQGGFDMYITENGKTEYKRSFMRPHEMNDGYTSIIHFGDNKMRDITINFPLYNNVEALYIGIQETAQITGGGRYKYEKPVLYYGSSITQGGCASRPGNSYQGFISRKYDCDFINLGFSGCGMGEDAIVDYMRELDVSIFVCDYDHNAPTAEHLKATHERLYRRYREKQPDTPIIFISKPDFLGREADIIRRDIIKATYDKAVAEGDKNVYFIPGETLFNGNLDCTVDSAHPNDLGFYHMGNVIGEVVGRILENK